MAVRALAVGAGFGHDFTGEWVMAFLDWLRGGARRAVGRDADGPPREPSADTTDLAAAVEPLWRPCVLLRPTGVAPTSATDSFVGGHPHLPAGVSWPTRDGRPLMFVGQFDLAGLPRLEDFPGQGLLQWFVVADDVFGLTFDDAAGTVGFEVRWYDDPSAPSVARPTAELPSGADPTGSGDGRAWFPMRVGADGPVAVSGTAARCLPGFAEVPERLHPLLADHAEQVGEDRDELEFVWEEYVAGPSSPFDVAVGSMLGGTASFTQFDPRGTGGYPAAHAPAGRQLVQLDSAEFGGWGDGGIAHLFGDPEALQHGDVSAVTYHWDCS